LAAKAASIVASADNAEREDVAVEAVRAIVSKAVLAPSVVGRFLRFLPIVVQQLPRSNHFVDEQAAEIVKAATSAAPRQADRIAAAVAKAAPKSAVK
jgi:hypothetical protein